MRGPGLNQGVVLLQILILSVLIALIAGALLRLRLTDRMLTQRANFTVHSKYLAEGAMAVALAKWKTSSPTCLISTTDSDLQALAAKTGKRIVVCAPASNGAWNIYTCSDSESPPCSCTDCN